MILPLIGFVVFVVACIVSAFVGILVLRWTEPRIGKSRWSLLAFVIGSWPGAVGCAVGYGSALVHFAPTLVARSAILVVFFVGGVIGGLFAVWLLDQVLERLARTDQSLDFQSLRESVRECSQLPVIFRGPCRIETVTASVC